MPTPTTCSGGRLPAGALTALILTVSVVTPRAELIGHWKFDEAAEATVALDELGTNDGTIVGAVTTGVTGVAGNAYQFNPNAEETGFIEVGDASFLADIVEAGGADLNTFTLSGWIKFTDPHFGQIVFIGDDTSGVEYLAYGPQDAKIRSWYRGAGGGQLGNLGPDINDDAWHHVALTVSPTQMITYVDGVEVSTEDATYADISDANSLDFGRLGRVNDGDYLQGFLDDIQIYNTTLGPSDIAFLSDNPGTVFVITDADGDGMPDTWETENGLDPNDSTGDDGAGGDPDEDGLTNLEEFDPSVGPNPSSPQTNPLLADTDGDGLTDSQENNTGEWIDENQTGTDPTVADTDSDGLEDGAENPDTSYVEGSNAGTDPNQVDSDGDGWGDGVEFNAPTDPTDPADSPPLAPLIATEPFDYPEASALDGLNGGAGWTGAWDQTAGAYEVIGDELVGQQENAVQQAFRLFPTVAQGSLYLTFTASVPSLEPSTGGGIGVTGLSLHEDDTEWVFLGFRDSFFRLDGAASGDGNDRNTDPDSAMPNNKFAFVLEINFDSSTGGEETFNAWIFDDNVLPSTLPAEPDMTTSYDIGDAVGLNRLRIFDNENVAGTFDNLSLATSYAAVPKSGGIAITDFSITDPDQVDITFTSTPGNLYSVKQSLTLGGFTEIAEITATDTSTLFSRDGVELVDQEFFVVEDLGEAPPILGEDFESGADGWTVVDLSGGGNTEWELGTPDGDFVVGANSGANAFGTDIDGAFVEGTDTALRSPAIDLTGLTAADVSWSQSLDFQAGDTAVVNLRKSDGSQTIELTSVTDDGGGANLDWSVDTAMIDVTALDQQALDQYQLEFRFTAGGDVSNYEGWYVDDVELSTP